MGPYEIFLQYNDSVYILGGCLVINPYQPGNADQQWRFDGLKFQNRVNPNLVLDIARCDASDGASVCAWEYNGQNNQHWNIEIVQVD